MDHAFQFPVNLNSGDSDGTPPPGDDTSGKPKPEMDFFALSRSKTHYEGLSLLGDHDHSNTSDNDPDVNTGLNLLMMNSSTIEEDRVSSKTKENPKTEVAELQSELEQLAGENQRLRNMLTQATTDYSSLQLQLIAVIEDRKRENNHPDTETDNFDDKKEKLPVVPRQFMDLGLGSDATNYDVQNTEDNSRSLSGDRSPNRVGSNNELEADSKGADQESRYGQCKEPGRRTSSRLRERSPDRELSIWNSKLPRFNSPPKGTVDQAATEATMRKARVSVRARSESNMISDGCQWRKYGQKMAKGNPCPRAYYRCTMTGNCPVRKQVQRCAEDRTILVTTYEGNHNHPLPPAAMAMASTTSSAARMLLSGSMSSTDSLMNANFLARTLLPCSTMATISASAPFPTVTLDLTQNPNSNPLQTPSNPFMNPNGNFPNPSAALQILRQAMFNQTKFSGLQMSSQDSKGANNSDDNLTAATAAIAADPNFTAALAAAISSIMGGGSQSNGGGTNNATSNTSNGNGKINNSTN